MQPFLPNDSQGTPGDACKISTLDLCAMTGLQKSLFLKFRHNLENGTDKQM